MKHRGKLIAAAGLAAVALFACAIGIGVPYYMKNSYRAPAPVLAEGQFAPFPELGEVDFAVPTDGSMEEARDRIREARANGNDKHFTVLIEDGEYSITNIAFDERDHDTTYRSRDGGAVLNGSTALDPENFIAWDKNENIKVIDLTKLGLSEKEWGKLYAYGAHIMAARYDDGIGPLPCELYFNGKRCTIARYPNGDEWLKTGRVIDEGDRSGDNNPRGGTFALDEKTAERVANWADTRDIWVYGFFKYDWAETPTRVKAIDHSAGTLTTEHGSSGGFDQGKPYYFYNVLEELDEPGEWYLDREAGLLYLWPPEGDFDDSRIGLTLNTEHLITGCNLKNFSLVGLTLQGTRGDAMVLSGENITVDHCVIQNIAGSALTMDGTGNTASNNTVRHVGSKGISISGGDLQALTPGRSRAVNNLVHDWAEVITTYQGGVNVYGVGNTISHNEIFNAPHTAIFFGGRNFGAINLFEGDEIVTHPHFSVLLGGNNNVIEHNLIHDVCLLTDDAGAIYSGRSLWDAQGTAIRNNVLYNLGGGGHTPDGIYLDDGLSGITVENNLLVNVPGLAIHLSGRDLEVHGNVVVNAGRPVSYDERMRGGALDENHWFHGHSREGGPLWTELFASPWQTDLWKAAYPKLAAYTSDFNDTDNPSFAANCADSSVTGNRFIGPNKPNYAESVLRFSEIGPNAVLGAWKGRKYWGLPGYEDILTGQAGRKIERGVFMSDIVLPTEEQQAWADLEIGVLIHMDMPTFVPEYEFRKQRGYTPPAEVFAPMQLDTDQWVQAAKAAGAKYAVLVAKHCSGFCLWPTDEHEYSIKNSPWKDGAGDIVGDFFASCEKYGLRPGLYYSASCNAYCNVDNPGTVLSGDRAEQEQYNAMVLAQLTELWTRYGNVFEIWFDGGCLPPEQGGPDIAALLYRLQPDAVVFGGPVGAKSLLRWVGNEKGIAPEDCWATGDPYGQTWSPAESDLPNRYAKQAFQGGWFWRAGEEHAIVPAEDLFDVYLQSVGRNTNMLIGMVIDDRGLFPEADAAVFAQFGELVQQAFGAPVASLSQDELRALPDKYHYRLPLPEGAAPKYLVLMEDISQGERVLGFTVNGTATGKCIGHKRIIELPPDVREVALVITQAKDEPVLRSVAVF